MELLFRTEGHISVLGVEASRIDAPVAVAFKEAFRQHTASRPAQVILDLTRVDFIDSSGLGAIVAAMKLLGPDGILHLAGMSPMVRRVFQLTRMDTIFRIYDTLEDALDAQRP